MDEAKFRYHYRNLSAEYEAAFPTIPLPDVSWWTLWLQKYEPAAISEAISTLGQHPLKPKFTGASTGRAITAMLRQSAVQRAIAKVNAERSK